MNHILLARRLTVTPLSPSIGALIEGINLARPLDPQNQARIEQALLAHKVLFFEDQTLTPDQQRDFAACFGKLHIHPIYPTVEDTPEVLILDTEPLPGIFPLIGRADSPQCSEEMSGGDTMWLEYTDENGMVHRWYEPLDDWNNN